MTEDAAGQAFYFLVFNNPAAGREAEYLAWYDTRHIIDVTAIPGFRTGRRFVRNETQMYPGVEPRLPDYLTLYEVRTDDLDALNAEILARIRSGVTKFEQPSLFEDGTGIVYWYRLNTPEIARALPMPSGFAGRPMVDLIHIVFMNAAEGRQAEWEDWYDRIHSPDMLMGDGIINSQRTTLARAAPEAIVPPTREMVLFRLSLPEGMPAEAARPAIPYDGSPIPQDVKATRGYTYRSIAPVVTHEEAIARKAAFAS